MKTKRIISLLLAVLTIMGSLVITVGATDAEKTYEYTNNTTNTKPTIDYIKGVTIPEEEGVNGVAVNTEEKKLATMDLKLAKDGYLLYIDQYSGEIAVICEATGESIFSNPVNVGSSNSANTEDIRAQILSQLVGDLARHRRQSRCFYRRSRYRRHSVRSRTLSERAQSQRGDLRR